MAIINFKKNRFGIKHIYFCQQYFPIYRHRIKFHLSISVLCHQQTDGESQSKQRCQQTHNIHLHLKNNIYIQRVFALNDLYCCVSRRFIDQQIMYLIDQYELLNNIKIRNKTILLFVSIHVRTEKGFTDLCNEIVCITKTYKYQPMTTQQIDL